MSCKFSRVSSVLPLTGNKLLLLLAAGVLTLLVSGPATAGWVLRVAAQEDSAPKFVVGAEVSGEVKGACPDVMRAIERQDPSLRFVFEAHAQPLRRIVSRMEHAEVDANCLVDNDERRASLRVVAVTLFSFDYHLIARADDQVKIGSWDDVRRLGPQGRILAGEAWHELPQDKDIVFHCKGGTRSAAVLAAARAAGYERVSHLDGGILAWVRDVEPDKPVY